MPHRLLLVLLVATLALPAAAAPRRVTMMPLAESSGVDAAARRLLGDALLTELRRRSDLQVLSFDDVRAVLTVEQQQQLLGCGDAACMKDLSAGLATDELVTASIGLLGKSWVVIVRRVDVATATTTREVNRRLAGGKADKVLAVFPAIVTELFDRGEEESKAVAPPAPVAVDCSAACRHVVACKGTYVDGDLDALVGTTECLEACVAGVAIGDDPENLRKKGRREAAWRCATAATECLDLDKRCDVF